MRRLKGEEGGVTTDGREREKQREREEGMVRKWGGEGKMYAKVGSRDEGKERVEERGKKKKRGRGEREKETGKNRGIDK